MAFEELKQRQAAAYSGSNFQRLAESIRPIHENLLGRLDLQPGERLLDAATGTGAVAMLAARLGARVTGQDLAEGLVQTARQIATEEGIEVHWDVGDCERMPYADHSFDVVCSAMGAIFAPDHEAVAREFTRLCAPGGRIGLTAWRPEGAIAGFFRMMSGFQPPPPPGAGMPLDWGRPEHARELLGDDFELAFFEGDCPQEGESPEAIWELFLDAFGPLKALAASLDEDRREQLHGAFIDYHASHTGADGRVRIPREYLVIIGDKR